MESASRNFRRIVKVCAEESQVVELFNFAYDARLKAPISALIEDRWSPASCITDEDFHVGCFIVFVHERIWHPLQMAQARISRALPRSRYSTVRDMGALTRLRSIQ